MKEEPLPALEALATKQLLVLLDDARAFGPQGHVYRDVPLPERTARGHRPSGRW